MATPEQDNESESAASAATAQPAAGGLLQSIGRNALLLGAFALLCTAFIASTFLGTSDEIAEQQRQARLRALYEIVPTTVHDNDLLQDNMPFFEEGLGHRREQLLFLAKRGGKPRALIYPATARDGYSGDIRFIVGVNVDDNSIAGVRVIEHRETPGLGDGIETRKSDWILGFNGKRLGNPPLQRWAVKKEGGDFDAFTGATITPRALVQSIALVLQYHEQHGKNLVQALMQQNKQKPGESNKHAAHHSQHGAKRG